MLLTLVACGANRPPKAQTLANVFPLTDGAQWVFRNASSGALTTIAFSKYDLPWGCENNGHQLFMSTWTKTDAGTYWNPGQNDELHMLWEDSGTEIRSRGANIFKGDLNQFWTLNYVKAGSEDPYPIAPKSFTVDATQLVTAPYLLRAETAEPAPKSTCLTDAEAAADTQNITWTTEWTTGNICIPFYCGPVVFSHQRENFPAFTNEEVWALAPGLGIVQIEDRLAGGQAPGPNGSFVVIQRIQ